MFKIGCLVVYDNQGAPTMARMEGREPSGRVRIVIIRSGERLTVPPGDVALPGEDRAARARERNFYDWSYTAGGALTNGQGGYVQGTDANPALL